MSLKLEFIENMHNHKTTITWSSVMSAKEINKEILFVVKIIVMLVHSNGIAS